ncbi:MAG: FAD-binding dehydrogenase, partial [Novosphingobium sp.]
AQADPRVRPARPPRRGPAGRGEGSLRQGGGRVVRPDGTPLPNLLAGGGAARSVSGPSSWGYLPAMGLCTAVTLGRLAGESAAKVAR